MLWIDDQAQPGDATVRLLGLEGIQVDVAQTATEGLKLATHSPHDIILLDIHLPDLLGLTALRRLRGLGVSCPVVIMTGCYMEAEVEAEARGLGAAEFLRKPMIAGDQLATILKSIGSGPHVETASRPELGVIAASDVMREVLAWVKLIGPRAVPVLLTGETGTGKEVIARAIHEASGRRGRFVALNCGAIPDTLFESELFGHAKGAYTGATSAKPGLLEEAHGGTLLLDEIADLPANQQVRLLRVLDTGELRRLGETNVRNVDVRIVAATNRPLREDVAGKRFREDLFYRLNVATRHIPPLRERPDDIDALVRFWEAAAWVSPDAMTVLRAQPWRGNVRELRSVFERALCLANGPILREQEITAALSGCVVPPLQADGKRERAAAALQTCGGNAREAATLLGINKATLYRWLGPGGRARLDD